jgi:hypothetical protein
VEPTHLEIPNLIIRVSASRQLGGRAHHAGSGGAHLRANVQRAKSYLPVLFKGGDRLVTTDRPPPQDGNPPPFSIVRSI